MTDHTTTPQIQLSVLLWKYGGISMNIWYVPPPPPLLRTPFLHFLFVFALSLFFILFLFICFVLFIYINFFLNIKRQIGNNSQREPHDWLRPRLELDYPNLYWSDLYRKTWICSKSVSFLEFNPSITARLQMKPLCRNVRVKLYFL